MVAQVEGKRPEIKHPTEQQEQQDIQGLEDDGGEE